MVGETKSQLSLTRAAPTINGHAKNQIPISRTTPRNLPPTVITNFLSDPQRTRMSALRIVLALATGALALAAPIAPAQVPLPDDFNPGANDSVYSLAVQADGKILVGGYFTTLGGQTRNYLGRLNPDGTLDTGFNPGANSYVYSLAVQADGKILVGGVFSTLGGQTRNGIGRLNPDGTLDTAFNPGANGGSVDSLAVQADGKILVGGQFTTLGGQTRNRIGRLNPDGTLDTAFNPGANSSVTSLAVQADGKILVGGAFTTLGRAAAQLPWPAQPGRHAGHHVRSGGEFLRVFPGGAGGREDSGGRRVHHAGRADAQLDWPAQPGRHAGHHVQSGGE